MNDQFSDDLGTLIDTAKAAKEIFPQTVSETDEALATLVGWFNNVVLYPVKKANITYRYKLECFEDDLRMKVMEIPDHKLCEPNLMIAGPTLEALKYSYDEQALREMYVNLLAASINSDKTEMTHPAFVDIIKSMSPLDAQNIKIINEQFCPVVKIVKRTRSSNLGLILGDANLLNGPIFLSNSQCNDLARCAISLDNLERLNLININFKDIHFNDIEVEKPFKETDIYTEIIDEWTPRLEEYQSIELAHGIVELTIFGQLFCSICISSIDD